MTGKLLTTYGIKTPTQTFHQHTKDPQTLLVHLDKKCTNIAYVSDAGTPGISDPGGKLVAAAVQIGMEVTAIPGPSAVATALSVCGFPTDRFTFMGFPPNKKGRNSYFKSIDDLQHTVALYESKHRIIKTLEQLPQDRHMMLGRELTKMHETMYRGKAPEVINQLNETSQKGEFVIVLAPKQWTL